MGVLMRACLLQVVQPVTHGRSIPLQPFNVSPHVFLSPFLQPGLCQVLLVLLERLINLHSTISLA